jgi:multidrug efflux system membrane fusion protein
LLVLLGLAAGCRPKDIASPLPVAVEVVTLTREAVACRTQSSATVRQWQEVELSFKVAGTVVDVLQVRAADGRFRDIQEGDVVSGDVRQALAHLDDADYRRQRTAAAERLAQARAQEQAVAAGLSAAENEYVRFQAMWEQKAVAAQAMDDVRARRNTLQAELEAARREIAAATVAVQQADDDLQSCTLPSPLPQATISRKYVEPHERVQAGQPVFQIMDLSRVRAAFGVPDTKIGQFCLGQTLKVQADAFPGESFSGQVTKIYPAADPRTRTFEIEVAIDQPRGLKPGMVVTILSGDEEAMLLLPLTAIQRGDQPGEYVVWTVVSEDGRQVARRRRVNLNGVYDNRIRLESDATSEIRPGDPVVVRGSTRLTEGQAVRVLPGEDLKILAQLTLAGGTR